MSDAIEALVAAGPEARGGEAEASARRAVWRGATRERRWRARHAPLTGAEAAPDPSRPDNGGATRATRHTSIAALRPIDRMVLELRFLRHPRPLDTECIAAVGVGWSAVEKRAAALVRRLRGARAESGA